MSYRRDLFKLFGAIGVLVLALTSLGFATLPGDLEQQEMYVAAGKRPQELRRLREMDPATFSLVEASTAAKSYYAAGDLNAAIQIYEAIDAAGRLDAVGREQLAYYYGESQQPDKQYAMLAGLAQTHLNANDAHKVAAYFQARGLEDEQLKILEVIRSRDFATAADIFMLAKLYRQRGRNEDALAAFASVMSEDLTQVSVNDIRTMISLLGSIGRTDDIERLLVDWTVGELDEQEFNRRAGFLTSIDQFELVAALSEGRTFEDTKAWEYQRAALYQLKDKSPHYHARYIELLIAQLNAAQTAEAEQAFMFDIFNNAPSDTAYKLVRASSFRDTSLLEDVYTARLIGEGRTELAGQRILSKIKASETGDADKLRLAEKLASLNENALAVEAYRLLAQDAAPDSEAVSSLIYLWKAAGRAPDVDWIGARLLTASAQDYPAWESIFLGLSSSSRLLDWLERSSVAAAGREDVMATRLKLASWEPGNPRLGATLEAIAATPTLSVPFRQNALSLACSNGLNAATLQLAQEIGDPSDLSTQDTLCVARSFGAVEQGDAAMRWLSDARRRNIKLGVEDTLLYAKLSGEAGNQALSRQLKLEALQQLPEMSVASSDANLTRAWLQVDVGDPVAAASAFEAVLRDPGRNSNDLLRVRKALMQIYVDHGEFAKALKLSCEGLTCP